MKKIFQFCVFLIPFIASAQPDSTTLRLQGIYYEGKALIRWAPLDKAAWKGGLTGGYKLERYTTGQSGQALSTEAMYQSRVVLATALLPAAESAFDALANAGDDAAGVGGGAIYGDDFSIGDIGDELAKAVNTNTQEENRFGFGLFAADQSFTVARMMALGYEDATVQPNREYLYRVALAGSTQGAASFVVNTSTPAVLPILQRPTAQPGDKQALLSWPEDYTHFSSYVVECSADGGANYNQRNKKPLIGGADESGLILYGDSLDANGRLYIYRIRGRSPFGLLSAPSDTVHVWGRDPQSTLRPSIASAKEDAVSEGRVIVSWELPAELAGHIDGFQLCRSATVDGDFQPLHGGLLGLSVRSYTDGAPLPTGYYLVKARHKQGNDLASLVHMAQTADRTPPRAPNGLQGECDATGAVTLTWQANNEPDLKGYRVFTSTTPDGDFLQVTGDVATTNEYVHYLNLHTLAEKQYYKVMAVDHHENFSTLSPTATVLRPDVVPPSKALLKSADPLAGGIQLKWMPSSDPGLSRHELQRKQAGGVWSTLLTLPAPTRGEQTYLDTTARGMFNWHYRVMAYDAAGNGSSSGEAIAKSLAAPRSTVQNPKAETATANNQPAIQLSWNYQPEPGLHNFLIYRAKDGDLLRQYKTLPLDKYPAATEGLYTWKDTDIQTGAVYKYRIMARYLDGSSSVWSEEVGR